jgi:hypothetical protein
MVCPGIVDASPRRRLEMGMIRVEERVRVRGAWICIVLWLIGQRNDLIGE